MVVDMKVKILFFTLLISGCKVDVGTNENEQFKVLPISSNISFEQLKTYVMNPSCVRCHSWAQDEAAVQQRMIVGNPEGSILYQKIKSGSMPPSGALSSRHLAIVENYIKGTKSAPTIALNSTFKSIQFHLINKSCLSCHNDKGEEMSFEGYANISRRANKILNILEEGDSADTPMPPYDQAGNRKAPLPTAEIIEAFRTWIDEGKLDN
jgi:hypothetical protein